VQGRTAKPDKPKVVRILVVDDSELVRRSLRSFLSVHKDWLVCGEAVDGSEAVEKAKELHPDVILMDLSMPRMNGAEATQIIRREVPTARVILVTQNDPAIVSQQAPKIGAIGHVSKADISRKLLPAIESVVRGLPL
jgi:DNA-binding NarL/FixJ family response regulator